MEATPPRGPPSASPSNHQLSGFPSLSVKGLSASGQRRHTRHVEQPGPLLQGSVCLWWRSLWGQVQGQWTEGHPGDGPAGILDLGVCSAVDR